MGIESAMCLIIESDIQASSQWGASGCTAPTTNMGALTKNFQNITDTERVNSDRYKTCQILPQPRVALLNRRGRKHLVFKNVRKCKVLCAL